MKRGNIYSDLRPNTRPTCVDFCAECCCRILQKEHFSRRMRLQNISENITKYHNKNTKRFILNCRNICILDTDIM